MTLTDCMMHRDPLRYIQNSVEGGAEVGSLMCAASHPQESPASYRVQLLLGVMYVDFTYHVSVWTFTTQAPCWRVIDGTPYHSTLWDHLHNGMEFPACVLLAVPMAQCIMSTDGTVTC
jgi:hypothetical protein